MKLEDLTHEEAGLLKVRGELGCWSQWFRGLGLPLMSQRKGKGTLSSFLLELDMTHVRHA